MLTNFNPTTELLTPEDVAHLLKISKAGVYRLVDMRLVPFYKVMGSIRFKKSDITSFLENCRIDIVSPNKYGSTKN